MYEAIEIKRVVRRISCKRKEKGWRRRCFCGRETGRGREAKDMSGKAIEYGLSIVGAPYRWWTEGPVTDRGPAWAENTPPPPPEEVIAEGCFCAGVPNLLLRA